MLLAGLQVCLIMLGGLECHEEFVFQYDARTWCLHHVCAEDGHNLGPHVPLLLPALLERHLDVSVLALETGFRMAVEHNNERLLSLHMAHFTLPSANCRFEMRHQDRTIRYSLMNLAVCKGNSSIIHMLWPRADRPNLFDCRVPTFAICDAVYRGELEHFRRPKFMLPSHEKTLDMLPEHYKHVCKSGRNVLACAIWAKNNSAFEALLADSLFWENMDAKGCSRIVQEAVRVQDANALRRLKASARFTLEHEKILRLVQFAKDQGFHDAIDILLDFLSFKNNIARNQAITHVPFFLLNFWSLKLISVSKFRGSVIKAYFSGCITEPFFSCVAIVLVQPFSISPSRTPFLMPSDLLRNLGSNSQGKRKATLISFFSEKRR